jgi:hypothetical protein
MTLGAVRGTFAANYWRRRPQEGITRRVRILGRRRCSSNGSATKGEALANPIRFARP